MSRVMGYLVKFLEDLPLLKLVNMRGAHEPWHELLSLRAKEAI